MTTLLPPGVKVHLALGYVDMRKGIDGLAMLVQGVLRQDPFTGHLIGGMGVVLHHAQRPVPADGGDQLLRAPGLSEPPTHRLAQPVRR
jgi:IS66 Orf2 like protein